MKTFRINTNIGKTKYTVSFHDGVKTHKDGSPFYEIALFNNEKKRDMLVRQLLSEGYTEE